LLIVAFFALISGGPAFAITSADLIRIGYVDIQEIFDVYPGMDDVRQKLKQEKDRYQGEIDKRKDEVAHLQADYESKYSSLKDDEKQRREAEIEYKKELLAEYIDDSNRKLTSLKDELTKPIYVKIVSVIQKVSEEKGLSFVFRKGSDNLLYQDTRFDVTKDIITRLRKELQLEER
jgi:Skp family chaperone for outer membrane proteins